MLPDEPHNDQLSEKHQVTLILRMLMDEHSHLLHGELVDVSGNSWGHFSGWENLVTVLREWLTNQVNPES